MRIVIIAPGSRGDVQPYLALGKGLQRAGHLTRMVTYQNFKSLITAHGLDAQLVDSDIQAIAASSTLGDMSSQNPIGLMRRMAQVAKEQAVAFAHASLSACQDADLILTGIGGIFVAAGVAQKLNLPLLQAYVTPFTPTREFPSSLTPNIPKLFNRTSHHLAFQLMWQGFRPADNLVRKQILQLPPAPLAGPLASSSTRNLPTLYGISPTLIPPPRDWDASQQLTGFWFLNESESWTPTPALMDFLNAGLPPVYIGFGSMSNRDPKQTADLVISAVQKTDQRAVIISGWGGLRASHVPDSVFMTDSIPHAWLFPRVAAVIHHGGASTTAAGLRAGVPSVVIPYFGDQPFWGKRIHDIGAGPQPIPRKKLTVENLAQAIRQATTDLQMRERAREVGEKIQKEDGIQAAVEAIEKLARKISPRIG